MVASIALAAIGLALMPAPALLGYDGASRVIHLVVGPVLAAIGTVAATEIGRPSRRLGYPLGLALAAGPLFLGAAPAAAVVGVVGGAAAALLALSPVRTADRFAGGWTSLLDPSLLVTDRKEPPMHDEDLDRPSAAASATPDHAASADGPRRVVVVTGASAGVGRAVAHAFARRGDAVGLIARDRRALDETRAEVESLGGRALVLPLDVADADAVEQAAGEVEAALGPIDVWVNNAMVSVFSPVKEMTAAEFRRVTEVTYLGYVHGTLAALRRMLPRDRGAIVQVGSALAYRAIPLQSAYCAAKHAINGFTESLRTELIHDGSAVRLTLVQLPAVNTPQFDWVRSRLPGRPQPVPPIFQPEVVAEGIVWAAEHDRRELVIGFTALKAILGDKVAPGLLDEYLARTGYEAQQTSELEDPDRPDNLFDPVPGVHRTRGRFDRQARDSSPHLWLTTHRGATAGIAASVAVVTAIVGLAGARLLGARR